MTGLSKELLSIDPTNSKYQLDYGASICLLVKTYKMINDNITAKYEMENYLKFHRTFLFQSQKY